MTVLYLVVIPWFSVSLLAAGLLVVAGLHRERRREAMRRQPSIVGRERRLVREAEDLLRSTQ